MYSEVARGVNRQRVEQHEAMTVAAAHDLRAGELSAEQLADLRADAAALGGRLSTRSHDNATHGGHTTDERSPILGPQRRVADWVAARDHRADHTPLSLGKMIRGWTTNRWDGADAEQRAMLEGTIAGGGAMVPSPLSAELIDRARNASVVFQAGARLVPMDSNTLAVPRLTGSPNPAWRNENAAIAEGDLAFDRVTFTARSLALIVRASRELIEDAAEVPGVLEQDLAAQVAGELDRVALRGSGTAPEPRGVRNTSGITVTSLGANGGTLTYDHLIDAVQAVRAGNFDPSAVVAAPRTEAGLAKLKESGTSGAYLSPPPALAGLPRLVSNVVPTNLTQGTATTTSEVYVADWSKVWVGMRTNFTLTPLNERYADLGQVGFVVWMRADVQVVQPAAAAVLTGAL